MNNLICAVCPTCNRPELLGRAIRAFEKQTYENRYLIIVDDLGQYKNQKGDRWELISFPRRILSLGEKRNICASLAPENTYAYAVWDDDDLYMPWHLESLAEAFNRGPFVQPRTAIDFWGGKWKLVETFGKNRIVIVAKGKKKVTKRSKHGPVYCYHGCWGYTRELFRLIGGYKPINNGDDGEFQKAAVKQGFFSVDISPEFKPGYFYNRPFANRISELGDKVFTQNKENVPYIGNIPKWEDESVWEQEIPIEKIVRPW